MFGPNVRNSINVDLDYHIGKTSSSISIRKSKAFFGKVLRRRCRRDRHHHGKRNAGRRNRHSTPTRAVQRLGADGVLQEPGGPPGKALRESRQEREKFLVQLETSSSHLNDLKSISLSPWIASGVPLLRHPPRTRTSRRSAEDPRARAGPRDRPVQARTS